MNEVSNFDTNVYSDKLICPTTKWDDPPYQTSEASLNLTMECFNQGLCNVYNFIVAARTGPSMRLSDKTICMETVFGNNDEHLHYAVHNLYGYSQAIATQK